MNTKIYCNSENAIRRVLGISIGIGTQVFFLITIWFLFWFLKNGGSANSDSVFWIDTILAVQFAIPHSLLLIPSIRRFLGKWIIPEFYPLFYSVVTCINLLVTIGFWKTSDIVVWQLQGLSSMLVQTCFYLSWLALIYSLNRSGFGTQTGLPQWWKWVCRKPLPVPRFNPSGINLWLRHPVYLSFAALIWFTPLMTLDHAILTGCWTIYILCGSCFKDMRMRRYVGDAYRQYQQRVPGYPLMPFGPLARINAPIGQANSLRIRRRKSA